ncbi:hypothetical protein IQ241_02275 [Romeria aff. gracilis LEGE 07310]|uniref:Uncharacterized protein n=1 Tax=Vasconcelosia minhoensis LEGE 07310 TaxID=915328 RepID=A0A8J7DM88_9CYAN|nr:hypothetical protein [Romeria gracilis]MBE9076130.1 hypothetical protein [Romeria aff. gracilis LEGE 07310]
MRPRKSQKLDLNEAYPCPCRRRGRIVPIALTEAFGCDRCQQIFVVRDQNYVIEQLASHYSYKRAWRWNGHQWLLDRDVRRSYMLVLIVTVLLLAFCLILLATAKSPVNASATFRLLVAFLFLMGVVILLWSASRR